MTSYGVAVILIFFLLSGIFLIVVNPMINQTVDIVNPEITDGTVSMKYTTYFNLAVGLGKMMPIIILIGAVLWSIVRANEKRDSGV